MRRYRTLAAIVIVALAGQAAAGTYKVKRGDTLAGIARRHKTTVDALAQANKIADPNRIREGQVLALAAAATTATKGAGPQLIAGDRVVVGGAGQRTHTVKAGENLARIAAKYGTTTKDLAATNGIKKPSLIRIGAVLKVPGGAEPWLCPVAGRVWFSDSWGAPRPGGRRHMGTDLFAHRGTPVVAPVAGILSHSRGKVAGNAFYLKGEDGNVYYGAHLHQLEARPGRIARGARIGTVGSTGNAEGLTPHLHFEINLGGSRRVNPLYTAERWCR